MAPKKGKKKKDDDWEDEAFDMAAENEIKTEAEAKPAADEDDDFFGGAAKKKVSFAACRALWQREVTASSRFPCEPGSDARPRALPSVTG